MPALDRPAAEEDPGRSTRRLWPAVVAALLVLVGALAWQVDGFGPDAATNVARRRSGTWTLTTHTGLGAWVDVYDWTLELSGGEPSVRVDDVDTMAELGVQTLYIQTAHHRSAAVDVIEADRLGTLIDRAHDRGLDVVAWYLPTLVDVEADLDRLTASAALPVDGLAVDIESVEVADVTERNRRLLDLSQRLRQHVGPDKVLAAITPSAVHLQVVNPAFWPTFPWVELVSSYEVMLPMSYWSIRKDELRDGERYVGEDIDRIRASTGDDSYPVVPVGGIADGVTAAELEGMVRAIETRDAPGGGLYDWATSTPEQWASLSPLRERQASPDQ